MRISDLSSDVCSSDLLKEGGSEQPVHFRTSPRSNSDLALFTSGVKTWLSACLHRSRLPPHDGFVLLRSGSRHQHAELQEPPARQPTGSAQLRSSCRLWGAGSGTQIPFGKYGAAGQSPWVKDIGAVMTLPAAATMGRAAQVSPRVAPQH